MPVIATKYFGPISCDEGDIFEFAHGLPAFEHEKSFVLLNVPEKRPLVFLQSTATAGLCFLALPILVVDSHYRLAVPNEDLVLLDLELDTQPRIGEEVLVLTLLSVRDGKPATANLMAPVVINLQTRRGVQSIRRDFAYSHCHQFLQLVPNGSRSETRDSQAQFEETAC